jgi:hypothetical protein
VVAFAVSLGMTAKPEPTVDGVAALSASESNNPPYEPAGMLGMVIVQLPLLHDASDTLPAGCDTVEPAVE